jgi:hypothetical protein
VDSRFAASSVQQWRLHNIVRILSVLEEHNLPPAIRSQRTAQQSSDSPRPVRESGAYAAPEVKVLALDDDPLVDILEHLEPACDWIQEGLDMTNSTASHPERRPSGVLVHCQLGVSRSGAFIVGFCTFPTH